MKELDARPLEVSREGHVIFFEGRELKPDIRTLGDMKQVVADSEFLKNAEMNTKLYFMYRDVMREQDRQLFEKHKIRYDITIIPPMMLGKEFVKTKGHYHPESPSGLAYTEIYEVLEGEAWYIIQKKTGGNIIDVKLIKAKKGDKIIMPPGYGHITINPSKEMLVMSNIVSTEFSSEYGEILEKKGGVYYITKEGVEKNENYEDVPELEILKAPIIEKLNKGNMYKVFLENPKLFEFLNSPEKTDEILD